MFDSRNLYYKNPFGAVRVNQPVKFVFPAAKGLAAYGVALVVRKYDGEIRHIPLYPVKDGANHDESEYSAELILSEQGIYYYRFEVYALDGVLSFGKAERGGKAVCGSADEWQLTVYDGFSTPSFMSGGVIYHIFADRFKKGAGKRCSAEKIRGADGGTSEGAWLKRKYAVTKNWDERPTVADPDGVFRANDFFGGNFEGITEELDYIASLGVNLIYLSPIFEASSNHRYDTADYFNIDPLLGDERDLKELIDQAAKRGIGVMFDGVFNHTGADSRYFNKFGHYGDIGAYQSKLSKYYDWFNFSRYPDEYDCWWGITVVPTLNKSNAGVRALIRAAVEKWTVFGFKGIRLDVADELPKDYLFDIRKTAKTISPDTYILGEVWEDASTKISYGTMRPYLLGSQLDAVMNYPFMKAILSFVKNGDKAAFKEAVLTISENYPEYALCLSMNIIDTHDTVRAANFFLDKNYSGLSKAQKSALEISKTEWTRAYEKLKMAALLQFTLPGIPSIYYGDEAGLTGFEDPLNRAAFPWGRENTQLLAFYRRLGAFRKEHREYLGLISFIEHSELLIYVLSGGRALVVVNNGGSDSRYVADRAYEDYLTGKIFGKGDAAQLKRGEYLLLSAL